MSVTCGWCLCGDHTERSLAPSCDCTATRNDDTSGRPCPCQAKPDLPAKPAAPTTRRKKATK